MVLVSDVQSEPIAHRNVRTDLFAGGSAVYASVLCDRHPKNPVDIDAENRPGISLRRWIDRALDTQRTACRQIAERGRRNSRSWANRGPGLAAQETTLERAARGQLERAAS